MLDAAHHVRVQYCKSEHRSSIFGCNPEIITAQKGCEGANANEQLIFNAFHAQHTSHCAAKCKILAGNRNYFPNLPMMLKEKDGVHSYTRNN